MYADCAFFCVPLATRALSERQHMSVIDVQNLTFSYPSSFDNIFENASFRIDTNWNLGLVGRNGRGKTTLLQLLQDKYEYSGKICGAVPFSYFPCEVPDEHARTIEVLREICPLAQDWEFVRELHSLGLPEEVLEQPFDTLSGGERTQMLLLALFADDTCFPLIDEPTDHLDLRARQKVSHWLSQKSGFILVSHDRAFLDGCIDHVLCIGREDIEVMQANFSTWWEEKARIQASEEAADARLKKEVRRLDIAARRSANWSAKTEKSRIGTHPADRGYIGHKAAKMAKRSKTIAARRQSVLEEKSGLLKNTESADSLQIRPLAWHADVLLRLADVSVCYGEKRIGEPISLEIHRGERIALDGRNGCGKSSLLKLILGEHSEHDGTVSVNPQLTFSYVPQETSHLSGCLMNYARSRSVDESLFLAILRKLGFERVQFEKDMADYSEGQKKKVLLAASLCDSAHLYVWDEPLNYVDIYSRMQIEELLCKYEPTMLFVEHDQTFRDKVATRTIRLQ